MSNRALQRILHRQRCSVINDLISDIHVPIESKEDIEVTSQVHKKRNEGLWTNNPKRVPIWIKDFIDLFRSNSVCCKRALRCSLCTSCASCRHLCMCLHIARRNSGCFSHLQPCHESKQLHIGYHLPQKPVHLPWIWCNLTFVGECFIRKKPLSSACWCTWPNIDAQFRS